VGDQPTVRRARRLRKRMGGSMRQVGILAAAALYAIDHHIERLTEDHRRARTLADGLAHIGGVRVVPCDTNIIYFDLDDSFGDLPAVIAAADARGVRVSAYGPRRLRAITHLDVDDRGIARALETFEAVLRAPAARGVDAPRGPWYGSQPSPYGRPKAADARRTSH